MPGQLTARAGQELGNPLSEHPSSLPAATADVDLHTAQADGFASCASRSAVGSGEVHSRKRSSNEGTAMRHGERVMKFARFGAARPAGAGSGGSDTAISPRTGVHGSAVARCAARQRQTRNATTTSKDDAAGWRGTATQNQTHVDPARRENQTTVRCRLMRDNRCDGWRA